MAKIFDAVLKLHDKFTPTIEKVSKELKKFQSKNRQLGRDFQNAGNLIHSVGAGMTKAITLPVLGISAAALKTSKDFNYAMSEVKAIAGATAGEFKKLETKAKEMGATTKFTATQSAEAMKYMAMAGWNTQQVMEGIPAVLNLAVASGEDLATTSDIVTDALTAFGLKAKDAAMFTDVLAKAATSSNTTVSLLGESFKSVAPIAGTLGFTVQDVSIALGLMANAGIKGSDAGTTLRSSLARLSKPTKDMQGAMQKYGISLTDSTGKMKTLRQIMDDLRGAFKNLDKAQQANALTTLFGKENMSGMAAIINSTKEDYKNLTTAIDNSSGAAQRMAQIMGNNLKGDIDRLKSSLEGTLLVIAERLEPKVRSFIGWITRLSDGFKKLDPGMQSFIINVALITAVIGPLLMIFGSVVSKIGLLLLTLSKVKELGGMLAALKMLGTGFLVIAGKVVLVIVILYVLYRAIKFVIEHWDQLKEAAGNALDWIKEKLSTFFHVFFGIIDGILSALDVFIGYLVGVFMNNFGAVWDTAKMIFQIFYGTISSLVKMVIGVFKGIGMFLKGVFTGDWSLAWEGIKTIFSSIWEGIKSIASNAINAVIGWVQGLIERVQTAISDLKSLPGRAMKAARSKFQQYVPRHATGTINYTGGYTWVHEKGGEIIDLPQGSRVIPHDQSVHEAYRMGKGSATSGNTTYNQYVTIPKLADEIKFRDESDMDIFLKKLNKRLTLAKMNTIRGI